MAKIKCTCDGCNKVFDADDTWQEIKCPHCNHEMTDPNCVITPEFKRSRITYVISACLILLIMFGYSVIQDFTSGGDDIVRNSSWDNSVSQIEDWFEENLNDPDSVEVINWYEIVKRDDEYLTRCKFRAKNTLGAYETAEWIFLLNKDGEVIKAGTL